MSKDNKIWNDLGLTDFEYEKIVEILDREPNLVELEVFGVMWSEHCSYKNSKPVLRKFPTEGEYVLQGPGENAGVVDIGDNLGIAFKLESHNHPTAIEPYEGAATGVGGIMRDIFTMGARPIGAVNSMRFGSLASERSRFLFEGAVEGIGGYGNRLGVPTIAGEVYFHPSYEENPLVNAMGLGLVKHEELKKGVAKGVGNPVMVVGAKTGRDGIRGASFASEELDEQSNKLPEVQAGDPFVEKLLMEACLELIQSGAVVGMQDMGAAGLTSSSCEMAAKGEGGLEMELSLVPMREEGMNPHEILISESQERMLVVPKKGKEGLVEEIFEKWGLDAVVIGHVTDDGIWRAKMNGEVVAEIPATALTDMCPIYENKGKKPAYIDELRAYSLDELEEPEDYGLVLLNLLKRPNIASKEWIYEQFDYLAGNNTVLKPGYEAGVLRIPGTNKGVATSVDCNPLYVYLDPFEGGKIALSEAARNVVCSGARPLGATNCLNFGNPYDEEIFWQFEKAVEGISDACRALETPITGGNVSFHNESKGESVLPTPTIAVVGLVKDLDKVCSPDFKEAGDKILLLGENKDELGASEFLTMIHGLETGKVPSLDLEVEAKLQKCTLELISSGLIKSAKDISKGGLLVAIAKSASLGDLGADIVLDDDIRNSALLFGETQSRIILTAEAKNVEIIKEIAHTFALNFAEIGEVQKESLDVKTKDLEFTVSLEDIKEQHRGAISCLMKK